MHVATMIEDTRTAMADHSDEGPMTTTEVSILLGLSRARINQLIVVTEPGMPKLSAKKSGRDWLVDRASVMRYLDYKKRLEAAKNSVVWEDAE